MALLVPADVSTRISYRPVSKGSGAASPPDGTRSGTTTRITRPSSLAGTSVIFAVPNRTVLRPGVPGTNPPSLDDDLDDGTRRNEHRVRAQRFDRRRRRVRSVE
jgi:hypothetical protein